MTVGPLRNAASIRPLLEMRSGLDRLSLQLATGRRAEYYSELGGGRSPSLDAREKISSINAFRQTTDQLSVRLSTLQTTLERFEGLRTEQRAANLDTMYAPVDGSRTASQVGAEQRLAEMLGLFNQEIDGRRLFSGRDTAADAAEAVEAVLNGVPPRAGLRDLINERNRADRGTDGLGRLSLPALGVGATNVTLSDTASGPFGLKIAAVGGVIDNATVTDTAGPPRSLSVNFTGVPTLESTVRITLALPTGGTTVVNMRATTNPSVRGEFALGADAAATAANFRAELERALRSTVTTDLIPASTIAASENFFDVSDTRMPDRVDVSGGPPETATGFVAGTDADTVRWYLGDGAADSARGTASVRIDTSVTVGYGLRANEPGFRRLLANIGAFAAAQFNSADPDAKASYAGLATRVRENLGKTDGQTIRLIQAEITVVQQSVQAARERQTSTKTLLENLVTDIEGVSKEEVAARILEIQTRLQAGYQATSMIAQMNLAQYL